MIEYINPIQIMIDVVKEMYPEVKALVYYTSRLANNDGDDKEEDAAVGCTIFPDDGSIPQIQLSIEIPFYGAFDVLAHELAHLVLGPDVEDEHGEEWEDLKEKILDESSKKLKEHYEIEEIQG